LSCTISFITQLTHPSAPIQVFRLVVDNSRSTTIWQPWIMSFFDRADDGVRCRYKQFDKRTANALIPSSTSQSSRHIVMRMQPRQLSLSPDVLQKLARVLVLRVHVGQQSALPLRRVHKLLDHASPLHASCVACEEDAERTILRGDDLQLLVITSVRNEPAYRRADQMRYHDRRRSGGEFNAFSVSEINTFRESAYTCVHQCVALRSSPVI